MRYVWFIGIAALLILIINGVQATPSRELWFFTADEIEAAYRYQLNFGSRIEHPVGGQECMFGQEKFSVFERGREFSLSCGFIKQTTRHIKEMLETGAARYLFPLDADHAHLAVPKNLWEEKYRKLSFQEILLAMLEDHSTVALYHTAEHLTIADPYTGRVDLKAKSWRDKRNVVGFYDGQPIAILRPDQSGAGVGLPEDYVTFGGFRFLASPGGQLYLFVRKEMILFDIALEFGRSSKDPILTGLTQSRAGPRD